MRHPTLIGLFVALFFALGLWAGCNVSYDVESGEYEYYCEDDDDCIDGFECEETNNVCQEIDDDNGPTGPPCDDSEDGIDQDGDGYGTGPDRSRCEHSDPDCDDSDPDVYPEAPQLCDGKANDCDDWDDQEEPPEEAIDDFSCDDGRDCSGVPGEDDDVYDGYTSDCGDDGVCYLFPTNSDRCEEAGDMELRCDSEAGDYTWTNNEGEEMTAEDCG
ncbi:MAG: hypothetical protein ACOCV2_04395 [Persicimonas sp.]